MEPVHLHIEPPRTEGDVLEVAATLTHPDGRCDRQWWRLPTAWADAVTTWADPFVVGLLFPMMAWGRDVRVEGRVSPSLLENLETFMAIWNVWRPDECRPVQIRADEEVEAPPPPGPGRTVMLFSCGVDSCFTLLRHRRGQMGRRNRNITGGVVLNGFNIRLSHPNGQAIYDGMLKDARTMLDSLDVGCISMSGDVEGLSTHPDNRHGVYLISGLHLFAGAFDAALVPNTVSADIIGRTWGTHPLTDPLLSSRHFRVIDDGAECQRYQKLQLLSEWPEAMRHLRVCGSNPDSHTNCGRCEKCIRTILAFRAAGLPLPPSLPRDISDREIRRFRIRGGVELGDWEQADLAVRQLGLSRESWARAARAPIRRCRRRIVLNRLKRPFLPLRSRIRTLFRGSPLSRRQQATGSGQPVSEGRDE
jgi:hypothetical protein